MEHLILNNLQHYGHQPKGPHPQPTPWLIYRAIRHPPYQRRYSWTWRQCADLWEDIEILDDGDHHLLGSIVCLVAPHGAGLNKLELVDGQQRLTSISLLLHVIRERLKTEEEDTLASELGGLLTAKALGEEGQPKIQLDSLDQVDYLKIISGEIDEETDNQRLHDAYSTFKKWVKELTIADLGVFLHRLRHQATIIRLEVSQAKDAFKLFETINNRGLNLSSTDIIKNFLLGNAARFDTSLLQKAKTIWSKLVAALDGLSTDVFFRHYLCAITKSRVSRGKVIEEFKNFFFSVVKEAEQLKEREYFGYGSVADDTEHEDEEEEFGHDETETSLPKQSFNDFITTLLKYADTYRELVRADTRNPEIDQHLRNLNLIKASPAYMFLMARRIETTDNKSFILILTQIETVLLRRQVCKNRTSDTEQLFARLCKNAKDSDLTEITRIISEYCPDDSSFERYFAQSTFTSANIDRARYCLESFEIAAQGQHVELAVLGSDRVQVEHIIPQKITTNRSKHQFGDWLTYLGEDAQTLHRSYVGNIGNLTLFAGALNIKASNNPYHSKCSEYRDSSLKITNSLPEDFSDFQFPQVKERANRLAQKALKIWPIPSV